MTVVHQICHTFFLFAINIYLKKLLAVIVRKAFIFVNTVGDLSQPNTGIMFTVPLDFVEGTVKKPVDKEKAKPKDIPEENEKNVS